MKVTHFFFVVFVWLWFGLLCFNRLLIICNGMQSFLATVSIMFYSCCFVCSVI